jgi:hypothetical protein
VARTVYGASLGDYAIDASGRPRGGAAFDVWDSLVGGAKVTDLLDAAGNPATTVVSDGSGFLRLSGPDGWVGDLYAEDVNGSRYVLRPVDLTSRVVAATNLLPLKAPADPIWWDAADWADGDFTDPDAPAITQSGHEIVVAGIGGVLNGHVISYGDSTALYFDVLGPSPITHVRGRFKVDNGSATPSGASSATIGIWNQVALNTGIRSPCHLAVTRTQIAYQVVVGDPTNPANIPIVQAYVFKTPLSEGNGNEILVEAWLNRDTGRARMFIDKGDERALLNVPEHDGIKVPGSIAFWEVVNAAPALNRTYYGISSGGADYADAPYAGRRAI